MIDKTREELEELQLHKLTLEIADLSRPMWQKPGMVTPVVAALFSIALGHYSGWFNVQSTKLENERFALTQEIEQFKREKTTIHAELQAAREELKAVSEQFALAAGELADARRKIVANTEKHIQEAQQLRGEVSRLMLERDQAIARNDRVGTERIAQELAMAEKALDSTQFDALDAINRVRRMFDIPESTLDDWEQKVKTEIYRTREVDEEGCFFDDDGQQHCLNF